MEPNAMTHSVLVADVTHATQKFPMLGRRNVAKPSKTDAFVIQ